MQVVVGRQRGGRTRYGDRTMLCSGRLASTPTAGRLTPFQQVHTGCPSLSGAADSSRPYTGNGNPSHIAECCATAWGVPEWSYLAMRSVYSARAPVSINRGNIGRDRSTTRCAVSPRHRSTCCHAPRPWSSARSPGHAAAQWFHDDLGHVVGFDRLHDGLVRRQEINPVR